MELIYLYIKKYENIFENVGFNFSSNYVASMNNNELIVEKNEMAVKNYYGDNISNVVMFLGKNGVGKSTLLDILGMNRHDRINDTMSKKGGRRHYKNSYFILYHLYEDYFGFEFVDDSFIKDKLIKNIEMGNEDMEGALYKLPMGNIFKFNEKIFKYCGNIMTQWLRKHESNCQLEYAYITSDKYNNRISNKYQEYNEEYTFDRRYYLEGRHCEYLYKYFVYLKDINNELLQDNNVIIENNIKIDEDMLYDDKEKYDYLHNKKRNLDYVLGLKDEIQIKFDKMFRGITPKKDLRSKKQIFLDTFCSEAIEYYFLKQFVGWIENEWKRIDIKKTDIDIKNLEDEIYKLDDNLKNEITNGSFDIMDFQNEYALLLYKIQNSKNDNNQINLSEVLRYTLNRVEKAASGIVTIADGYAVMEILQLLERLPESYFINKKTISIKCEPGKIDENIIEVLKRYDYYFQTRNDEIGNNCISRILNIVFPKMSEGQRVFLDIISEVTSAVNEMEAEDSLVLLIDEPDRALHPELSRRFLAELIETINKCKHKNIQLILSSHSPFIVTDILPEYVYSIEIENGKRKIINNKATYATNIYYLLMDSFMLENTFGEYSYLKLKEIINILNSTEDIGFDKLEQIKAVIDKIGEKAVKKKLLKLYETKLSKNKVDLLNMLMTEKNETKIKEIRKILERND